MTRASLSSSRASSRIGDMASMTLGREDHVMTWCSALNIYKVNRFHLLSDQPPSKKDHDEKVDIVTALLMHNMIEQAEWIFDLLGLKHAWICRRVNKIWHEFITHHMFRRWAFQMAKGDPLLTQDMCQHLEWADVSAAKPDDLFFGRICHNLYSLRDCWRRNKPRTYRVHCDSFVLSVVVMLTGNLRALIYCGLNNGELQMWSLPSSPTAARERYEKAREMEVHSKGVKCLAVEGQVMVTGSYDCTGKVWSRSDWILLHTITLHTDSLWDIKLKPNSLFRQNESRKLDDHYTLVTAGLDGVVGVFLLKRDHNRQKPVSVSEVHVLQAHDLVSAVDFNDKILVTGHEDSTIRVMDFNSRPLRSTAILPGHNGGVTGVVINGPVLASSSYDGSVKLWNLLNFSCMHTFNEPSSLVRCLAFVGPMLACGDFGGAIHTWEINMIPSSSVTAALDLHIVTHNVTAAHKGHVVCLQLTPAKLVSGSRDKTVFIQDFWPNNHGSGGTGSELTKEP